MGLKRSTVTVKWSEPALDDLQRSLDYIACDNLDAARALGKKARTATRGLREYPMKGRMVPEYGDPAMRELIVGPFRIIYTTEDSEIVYILAVVRVERLMDPDLLEH